MNLDVYGEEILERYKHPVNRGKFSDADATARDTNPSCGDELEIDIKVNDHKLMEAKFSGVGCAISQASTDILIDSVKGKSLETIITFSKEEHLKRIGVDPTSLRVRCALLPLKIIKLAAAEIISKK